LGPLLYEEQVSTLHHARAIHVPAGLICG
jgi:hypothetical protein